MNRNHQHPGPLLQKKRALVQNLLYYTSNGEPADYRGV